MTVELEWSRPTQTYGQLKGYRLKYGVKDQALKEIDKGKFIKRYKSFRYHKIRKLLIPIRYGDDELSDRKFGAWRRI